MISPQTTAVEGRMLPSDLACFLVAAVVLMLLVVGSRWRGRGGHATPAAVQPPSTKRAPKPFAGLTHKPDCEACEPPAQSPPQTPGASPPRMSVPRGRQRQVDPPGHFGPPAPWAYPGRVNWGNSRAHGHPHGRRGRQRGGLGCRGSFRETLGTPLHAKQVAPAKLVWALAARAEGLGIRAVAC